MQSQLHLFRDGQWIPAASLEMLGDDKCRLEYLPEYVFSNEPLPVALGFPVGFDAMGTTEGLDGNLIPDRRPPAFLFDLVPQGRGRQYLIGALGLADAENLVMPLILAGAFNPIGCLRLNSAVAFYEDFRAKNPDATGAEGFDRDAIAHHTEDFLEHMALHAMLTAGTTGVQGVAPKFLLVQDERERWFADLALADHKAVKHWIAKRPRGRTERDLAVLHNEAAYLRVAGACGLRVPEEHFVADDTLFVRRFDRAVDLAQPAEKRLSRLHQESLASLAGLRGFGLPASQNQLLAALRAHCTDPLAETVEFLKRDVLNLALRNTDNHARNTAVQRRLDGSIALTPLFDCAPMFLDLEVVPRTVHWRDPEGRRLDRWIQVIEQLAVPDTERAAIACALADFAPIVGQLHAIAREHGVDAMVIEQCARSIDAQAEQLAQLASLAAPALTPNRTSRRPRHGR